ncbi:two-component sensor histidine kinase [Vibrio albus]|uniref:histidine kinase n=1 Tax=Vibrio albus TaxID=2200953 RepID=A0A2U3B9L0_9VIBR|nr:ATP-binding protein [Vibrio albus]PWI33480.1 two-component sensor histidine kinase [Vibrio albus]
MTKRNRSKKSPSLANNYLLVNRLSLVNRLLLTSLVFLPVFMSLGSLILYTAFKASLETSLQNQMQSQAYALMSDAELEKQGLWMPERMADPSFQQTSSGQFAWITDQNQPLWRSPSSILLDEPMLQPTSPVTPGEIHFEVPSDHFPYYQLIYDTRWQSENGEQFLRFVVAHDPSALSAELDSFSRQIIFWISGLTLLLLIIQYLITRWGLQPLDKIAVDLSRLESGKIQLLKGNYPKELNPVINNLNQVLTVQRTQRERFKNTLADLAHSLKTPLAIIKSNYQTTDDRIIDEQVTRMNNIISHHLSRAHLGYQPLAGHVAVLPLISRLTGAITKLDRYSNMDIQLRIADDVHFHGEDGDLMEIMGNLIENACKYGKSKIEISAMNSDKGLKISVEDDGPGIDLHLRTSILKRGARSDTASLGQGLGLAVVTDILSSYDGELNISTSHLGGACFSFILPNKVGK